jgi:uncharacterized phage protein gp47/JayE
MTGLTAEGFVAKRTPELKLELEQLLIDAFGAVNLNAASVFGQLVGLTVEQQADFWNHLEEVYWSQYPSSAVGVNLDRVASINGLTRLPAAATAATAVLTGVEGTVISAGRIAQATQTGHRYVLTGAVTLDADDSVGARVEVTVVTASTNYAINLNGVPYVYNSGADPTEASILTGLLAIMPDGVTGQITSDGADAYIDLFYDTPQPVVVGARMVLTKVSNYGSVRGAVTGPLPLPTNALNAIVTPVAGWESVRNRFPGTEGRDIETDTAFRLRREQSLKLAGQNTIESITSRLRQLPGVLSQRVTVNNTNVTDSEGVPPHTIRAIVDGGTDDEIARTLFTYVAAGIGYFGAVEVEVLSEVTGTEFLVQFDRPVNVPYYVTVTIQGSPSTPTEAITYIREAMMEYAASLDIGDPVLYTRLFGPITAVIGDDAYVSELYINTVAIEDPEDELTANLIAEPDERFVLAPERIQVFVV